MPTTKPAVGDDVAYVADVGAMPVLGKVTRVWNDALVNILVDAVTEYTSVPVGGPWHPQCQLLETEPLGFDPAAAIVPNPIASVTEWMQAVTPTATMAEALCMEEMGETLQTFAVTDGETVDPTQAMVAEAMKGYAKALRQHQHELRVGYVDVNAAVDGHLDSVWVHLQAAAVLIGPENLAEAWSRLHKANVVDKKVDGVFVLDHTGKVTKPSTWVAPTYIDLIKEIK